MTGNFTCENTISEFLPLSTFNWCHGHTSGKRQFFYINKNINNCRSTWQGRQHRRLPQAANSLASHLHWATCMIYRTSRYNHVSSLLKELHWLRVPERIEFKLCSLVYKCLNGSGPAAYVTDSLQRVTDVKSRPRLRSSSSSTLVVPV